MARKSKQTTKTFRIIIDVDASGTSAELLELNNAVAWAVNKPQGESVTYNDVETVLKLGAVTGLTEFFPNRAVPSALTVRDVQCHVLDVPPKDVLASTNAALRGNNRAEPPAPPVDEYNPQAVKPGDD